MSDKIEMSDIDISVFPFDDVRRIMARNKSRLLVKVINKLSFELGHPKDDLVYLIKEMIKKGEL